MIAGKNPLLARFVFILLSSAGCGTTIRAGVLAVSDARGHFGGIVSVTAGAGFGSGDEARGQRSRVVAVTTGVRGGVLDNAPSGILDAHVGVDFIDLFRRVGYRLGAFVGGGGGFNLDGRNVGVGSVGARVAILPVLRAHVDALADRPGPCWRRRTDLLGIEAAASYLFGADRLLISFGPMYELVRAESGSCD
jgi:hypothetical protein